MQKKKYKNIDNNNKNKQIQQINMHGNTFQTLHTHTPTHTHIYHED